MDCNNYTAIFAPTYYEAKPLISYLEAKVEKDIGHCKFYLSEEQMIVIVISGVGAKNIRRSYLKLKEFCKPKQIILTGIAGGISQTAKLGEMYFINKILRYSIDEKGRFYEKGRSYSLKYEDESTNIINMLDDNLKAEYKRGSMVCVDAFLDNADIKKELFELSGALLADMESYELCKLSFKDNFHFECYKIISDTSKENIRINFREFCDRFGERNFLLLIEYLIKHPLKILTIIKFARNLKKIRPRIFDLARFVKEAS